MCDLDCFSLAMMLCLEMEMEMVFVLSLAISLFDILHTVPTHCSGIYYSLLVSYRVDPYSNRIKRDD